VSAEQQTAGRGRRGRRWISPFGRNIYLSSLWKFAGKPEVIGGLSLAVGVAVAEALAETGFGDVKLKWPNDILYGDAKLGGILIETSGCASGPTTAVIGIGLNLGMPAEAAAEIDQPWTDLALAGNRVLRNELLAAVLNHLLPLLDEYESRGLEPWRERWLKRNAFGGRQVCLQQGDRQIVGTMLGIGDRGELRLDVGGSELFFDGGEVSLRAVS
jgi:BirA family biotin operon repressor/biotin-[acetyl-CoA-carboxylase] ligase